MNVIDKWSAAWMIMFMYFWQGSFYISEQMLTLEQLVLFCGIPLQEKQATCLKNGSRKLVVNEMYSFTDFYSQCCKCSPKLGYKTHILMVELGVYMNQLWVYCPIYLINHGYIYHTYILCIFSFFDTTSTWCIRNY